jgi:hypothetical protein
MKNKITSLACIAGLGATAMMATGEAKALSSRTRFNPGATGWSDAPIGGGGQLVANIVLAPTGTALNVGPATSGFFTSEIWATCPGGVVLNDWRVGWNDANGDIFLFCAGSAQPLNATGEIDDL